MNLDYIEVNGKDFKEYNNILRHKAQPIDFGPKSILTASQYHIVYVEENFTSFHNLNLQTHDLEFSFWEHFCP